jgi:hypothetical protein
MDRRQIGRGGDKLEGWEGEKPGKMPKAHMAKNNFYSFFFSFSFFFFGAQMKE